MPGKKQDLIDQNLQDLNNDGVDRRGFLCAPNGWSLIDTRLQALSARAT